DLVAPEAEVLDAEARRPGPHHARAPGAEVLHSPRPRARVVEVDPVVREGRLVVDDERDQAELAVAQTPGGGDDLGRRRRVEGEDQLAERDARQYGVDRQLELALVRPDDDALDPARAVVRDRGAAV